MSRIAGCYPPDDEGSLKLMRAFPGEHGATSDSARVARVLMVGPDIAAEGGIAVVLRNYQRTDFWSRFGVEHHVSSGPWHGLRELWLQFRQFVQFPVTLGSSQADVVAIHTSSRLCLYRSVAYLCLARLARRSVVLHIHPASFIAEYKAAGRVHRWLVSWAVSQCVSVVALSDGIAEELRGLFPDASIVVIPNPVDTAAFCFADDDYRAKPPVVLYMGAILREKGPFDLVDAMPDLLARWPGLVVKFAGNHNLQELQDHLRLRCVSHAAQVLGWVAGEDRFELLATSRVLVLPSHSEGLPNVILEAMASGLPVVATAVGGVPSVIRDGVNGLLVPPKDRAQLVQAIDEILKNPSLAKQLALSARETVVASYSLGAISEALTSLYEKLCPAGPGAAPGRRVGGA